jgi:transcriptional regulator with XRE-family HTH domain
MLAELGRELRVARIGSGMRQSDVARSVGASASHVSRVELGRVRRMSIARLTRHAAAVGLRPSIRLYPLARRLLDQPQIALLDRFRRRLHPSWTWRTEVPMPIHSDLRSGDCVIGIQGCLVLVEAFTRLANWQAQTASSARKARDLGATRLIVLLAATHANRRALAEADPIRDGSFPIGTKAALAALGAGRDPGGDAIVVL